MPWGLILNPRGGAVEPLFLALEDAGMQCCAVLCSAVCSAVH